MANCKQCRLSVDSVYVYNIFIMNDNLRYIIGVTLVRGVEFVFFGGHFEFCSQLVRGLELKHLWSCSGKRSDLSRVFRQSHWSPDPRLFLFPGPRTS